MGEGSNRQARFRTYTPSGRRTGTPAEYRRSAVSRERRCQTSSNGVLWRSGTIYDRAILIKTHPSPPSPSPPSLLHKAQITAGRLDGFLVITDKIARQIVCAFPCIFLAALIYGNLCRVRAFEFSQRDTPSL